MAPLMLANGEMLPETFHFLGLGWWIVHIISIPVVGYIGYVIGKRRGSAKPMS